MQGTGTIFHWYDQLPFKILGKIVGIAEPIRGLSIDKVPFSWGLEHHTAFKQIKKEIVIAPILAYYNPKKKQHFNQMQASKCLVHICCRTRNQSTLQAKHLQRPSEGMLP